MTNSTSLSATGATTNDRRVLDVGCGLGWDGISMALRGARVTFLDVAETNLNLVQRVCSLLGLTNVDFVHLHNVASFSQLHPCYDVLWSQGSLITAPFEVIRFEMQELVKRLRTGGRWIGLAYPRIRWEREGSLPFASWGDVTDGGAPWMEWYDLQKLLSLVTPASFESVLYFEFHNNDFLWYDLVRKA